MSLTSGECGIRLVFEEEEIAIVGTTRQVLVL
jgi:hypothetical protein